MSTKHLYLFSGLGADHRAFERLDFTGFDVSHIHWDRPENGESLPDYSRRLAAQITVPNSVLIGLSFGGIVAGEVCKIVKAERLILLSSLKSADELPPYYRWSASLNLHKLLPSRALLTPNFVADWLFGVRNYADRRLLAGILHDTDPVFLRWAMNIIVNWRGAAPHPHLHHIHGTADRILPYRFIKPDITIAGGGHLMTLTNAREASEILRRLLTKN